MSPKVSVVMSVYNGEKYLQEAVESILDQTFTDFEFIIVDDGSTDATPAILSSYSDPRIIRLHNETNIGLTKSLNRGLVTARGEYIARHDVDDVALLDRLAVQVGYLESHPDVAFVGAGIQYIAADGATLGTYIPPTDPGLLRWRLLFSNPIRHPTVLWRRQAVQMAVGSYNPTIELAQDYEFWARLVDHLPVAMLPDVLVQFRRHPQTVSTTRRCQQLAFVCQISCAQLGRYLPDSDEMTLTDLHLLAHNQIASLSPQRLFHSCVSLLTLWCRFMAAASTAVNRVSDPSLIVTEVESLVRRALGRCEQQAWKATGWHIAFQYLRLCPRRAPALIRPLAGLTLPRWFLQTYRRYRYGSVAE